MRAKERFEQLDTCAARRRGAVYNMYTYTAERLKTNQPPGRRVHDAQRVFVSNCGELARDRGGRVRRLPPPHAARSSCARRHAYESALTAASHAAGASGCASASAEYHGHRPAGERLRKVVAHAERERAHLDRERGREVPSVG